MNTRRATSTQSRDGHVAGAPAPAPAEDKDGGVVDVSDVDASAPVAPETTQEVPLVASTEEYDEQAQAELEEERLELQKEQEAYAKIERGLAMAAEGSFSVPARAGGAKASPTLRPGQLGIRRSRPRSNWP